LTLEVVNLTINIKLRNLRKNLEAALTIFLLYLFIISAINPVVHAETGRAYIFMTPPMYIANEIGEVFNIAINISNVKDLRLAEFSVSYNTSLLDIDKVTQGTFFPPPPRTRFEFEKNVSLGSLKVSMSLADSENPISGEGDLAIISFKVVQSSLISCAICPLYLRQIQLLNSASTPINYDSVGAVYFWKSIQPDPPTGRLLDVYTQRGGEGLNQSGGGFLAGELVYLTSKVTYDNDPVQSKLVAFEVKNSRNETVLIRTALTDQNGLAITSFRIPQLLESKGTWYVFAVAEIREEIAYDTLSFQVYFPLAVGGYTVSIEAHTRAKPITPYIFSITALVIVLVKAKQWIRRRL
jgi:hypothetical protein